MGGTTFVDSVIDQATDLQSPGQKARKEWQNKSPEEQVYACREVLHGAFAPILHAAANGESLPISSLDMSEIEKIKGLFEATFDGYVEQRKNMSGSRS